MTARPRASISLADAPARTASTDCSCTERTSSYTESASSETPSPVAYVRVQSEQKPSTTAPQSIVTSTSRGIRTGRGDACGSAPCAPEATIDGNEGAEAPS